MKRILASVAVVSVAGSTFIGNAQAQTSIMPKDKKNEQSTDAVTYENPVTVNTNVLRVRTQP
ncbi:peptidase M23, partial [Bacillus cereus]